VTQPSYLLLDGEVVGRQVMLSTYQLEVLEPDRITLTLDANLASHFAYVGVYMASLTASNTDEGKLYSLDVGTSHVWPLFRDSVFDPIRFKYRITYVAYDNAGKPLPITTTDWIVGDGLTLAVRPPLTTNGT
jgi:hypothetical protein